MKGDEDIDLMSNEKLAKVCACYAAQKKAQDVLLMDMREITEIADYFIICTALSDTHARAVCNEIKEKLKKKFDQPVWHVEGYENGKWILLDYVSVVIHIFIKDFRDYYSLERLWGDAKMEHWNNDENKNFECEDL